jgi:hypothetical protein
LCGFRKFRVNKIYFLYFVDIIVEIFVKIIKMLKTYCKLKSNGVRVNWTSNQLARFAATQAATAAETKSIERNTEEWDKAKPYGAIPGPNFVALMRGFLPGGM